MTEWKDIPGYEGLYQASMDGAILSINRSTPRILKPALKRHGYYHLILCKDGSHKTHSVHRLVASTFIGPCPLAFDVNHKDGIKTNCSVNNLEYLSRSDNHKHAFTIGLRIAPKSMLGRFGSLHPNSKSVLQLDKQMRVLRTFGSIHEAERETMVRRANIMACCKGKRKYASGYSWRLGKTNKLKKGVLET